jgi:hypothetical protein
MLEQLKAARAQRAHDWASEKFFTATAGAGKRPRNARRCRPLLLLQAAAIALLLGAAAYYHHLQRRDQEAPAPRSGKPGQL